MNIEDLNARDLQDFLDDLENYEDDSYEPSELCGSCDEPGLRDDMVPCDGEWYHPKCGAAFGLIRCENCDESYNHKEVGRFCPECGEWN